MLNGGLDDLLEGKVGLKELLKNLMKIVKNLKINMMITKRLQLQLHEDDHQVKVVVEGDLQINIIE